VFVAQRWLKPFLFSRHLVPELGHAVRACDLGEKISLLSCAILMSGLLLAVPASAEDALGTDAASPAASPAANPAASPAANPAASPAANPAASPAGGIAATPPTSPKVVVVEAFNANLLNLLRNSDSLDQKGRSAALKPSLRKSFDLDFMAQKVLGRGWKKLTPEQREVWRESFAGLMTENYAGRFVGWSEQSFTTVEESEAGHGTVLVRTKLHVPGDEDVALDYRLRETPEGWRVIDVFLNGTVSELALRRAEYSGVLKRDGFDALIVAVDGKREELAAAAP
jgi:phospholipid transport system substrate-binding protein